MPGYVKLFSRILDSTIWCEDTETRIVWITLLAMADRDGMVECTIPGLASRAKVDLSHTEAALEKFQQPDKYSWSQVLDGRRIEKTDRGWFLINYETYREMLSADDVREKNRLRQERHRERHKRNVMSRSVTPLSRDVTPVTPNNDIAEAYTEAEAVKSKDGKAGLRPFAPPTIDEVSSYCQERQNRVDPYKFHAHYTSQGWLVGKNHMKDWRAAVRTWERNDYDSHPRSAVAPNQKPALGCQEYDTTGNKALVDAIKAGKAW